MKNLEFMELDAQELEEVNGGFVGAFFVGFFIGASIAALLFGKHESWQEAIS